MKIGIMDGVLRQSWETLFERAAALGFDGVELGIGADDYAQTMLWNDQGRREIAAWSRTSGTEVASVCLHLFWTYTFAHEEEKVRRTGREILRSTIGFCAEIGAGVILVPVTNPEGLGDEEANRYWRDEVRACAGLAEEKEVHIGLENVGRSQVRSAADLLALIQAVDSPFVGAYFDVGNAKSLGGDPVEGIRLLGPHIAEMHVKDPGGTVLGEGKVDLTGCMEALREIGYEGYLVLETPATDDPDGAARHNLQYLRALLA